MLCRAAVLACLAVLIKPAVAGATTVIPPTFDQLVSAAQTIFVGEVVGQRSVWDTSPRGNSIVTLVTFRVWDVWKGSVGPVTQLEFLGGTVGEITMNVEGLPTFQVGHRDVLFVTGTARAASPLVGFMYGRLRVERDPAGVDRVRMHDGQSLGTIEQVGAQRAASLVSITPMRLSDVAAAVRTRLGPGRAQ